MNVASTNNGDYIKILGVNFVHGASTFEARIASGASGGNIEVHLDDKSGTLIGTCPVPGTFGWQSWNRFLCCQ